MRIITSRTNPEIVTVHALKQAKERAHQQRFIAEGVRVCKTLLEYGMKPSMLYVTENQRDQAQELLNASRTNNASLITLVSESVMAKISTATTPSGILGVFSIPAQKVPAPITRGLVLAQITDPGNMGTLIRTAMAVGVTTIITVEGVDPWSPKVVHASAGTIGGATILQLTWQELVNLRGNAPLCALVVRDGKPIDTVRSENTLLVVGNESHGLPEAWLADCEQRVTLPMPGGTESLNAAVAGSIALYVIYTK